MELGSGRGEGLAHAVESLRARLDPQQLAHLQAGQARSTDPATLMVHLAARHGPCRYRPWPRAPSG